MKYGARNQAVGTVKEIKKGSLMCQVSLTTDSPVDVSSVMTLDSLADLGLKKGDRVRAVIKAIHVLLVRE
jgi:molybdate transport system regulatory protein